MVTRLFGVGPEALGSWGWGSASDEWMRLPLHLHLTMPPEALAHVERLAEEVRRLQTENRSLRLAAALLEPVQKKKRGRPPKEKETKMRKKSGAPPKIIYEDWLSDVENEKIEKSIGTDTGALISLWRQFCRDTGRPHSARVERGWLKLARPIVSKARARRRQLQNLEENPPD